MYALPCASLLLGCCADLNVGALILFLTFTQVWSQYPRTAPHLLDPRLISLLHLSRMALAFVEAGAHVYAIDVPEQPSEEFKIVAEHCRIMNRDLK